jgi:hypothetical protein
MQLFLAFFLFRCWNTNEIHTYNVEIHTMLNSWNTIGEILTERNNRNKLQQLFRNSKNAFFQQNEWHWNKKNAKKSCIRRVASWRSFCFNVEIQTKYIHTMLKYIRCWIVEIQLRKSWQKEMIAINCKNFSEIRRMHSSNKMSDIEKKRSPRKVA